MLNKILEHKTEELPSLERFKQLGAKMVVDMKTPVLASLNIRNLKYFNEIYGTDQGDWLISLMVDDFCRENSKCVIGTMSYSDHLLLLCESSTESQERITDFFNRLADQFLEEVNLYHKRAKVHVECGLYLMKPGDDFIYAQDNARYARRSIQGSYTTTVAWYSEDMRQISVKKASIIPNFEHAMEKDDILVFLQPKYSVKEQRIIGAEALSRFSDEKGEVISPALFVPVLEQAGIVSRLDYRVLEETVKLLAKWKKDGHTLFPISVNLSRVDLAENDFIERLDAVVEQAGVDKKYIEFELTETVLVQDLDNIITKLKSLRDKGYRIALDDFGSGYNSLYVLGQVPANVIKFDRGFVLHSIQNEMGMTILHNLVDTFKEIKFEVLCEGVETEEEKEKIVSCGCEVIQGYLYDKPLSIPDFERKYIYTDEGRQAGIC
jgi:EAL domain-containing protein (putative c-di-GMP-specific phosphodiesterase class I)